MGVPKLRTMVVYIVWTVACWGGAWLVKDLQNALAPVGVVGLAFVGTAFLVGAGIAGWNYLYWARNERKFEEARYKAITPAAELARVVATLRPDQTALLPQARYQAEIGTVAGGNGPEYYLLTPFMNIPLVWLDEYVNELCTSVEFYPVSRFASDSLEQRYAQAFTAWATQPHLYMAIGAEGNKPARWASPNARQRCVEMIWGKEEVN